MSRSTVAFAKLLARKSPLQPVTSFKMGYNYCLHYSLKLLPVSSIVITLGAHHLFSVSAQDMVITTLIGRTFKLFYLAIAISWSNKLLAIQLVSF